jgi:hypothetical protein
MFGKEVLAFDLEQIRYENFAGWYKKFWCEKFKFGLEKFRYEKFAN